MNFRVQVSPRAEADAEEVYEWIAKERGEPVNADRWLDGLEVAVQSLRSKPRRCRLAPESAFFEKEVRQLWYHSHRLLFIIDGQDVMILHIRHGARRLLEPEDL